MTATRILVLGLALAGTLLFAGKTDAQLPFRWFGPKTPDKSAPAKTIAPDPRRVIEISVEIAWLSDPVTYPYYLEAHINGAQLEVRGYVPNKAVREHALRIAQVTSSMPVADSTKEHASLLVQPSALSQKQLQSSVLSSLRAALPKQYQHLKIECGKDGRVVVAGQLNTFEEKIAVSHSLRRLHGCTSVQNLTSVPNEYALMPKHRPPTVAQNNPPMNQEPPLIEPKGNGPVLIPSIGVSRNPQDVIKTESPKDPQPAPTPPTPPATPLNLRDLEKRIKAIGAQVLSVEATFTSKTDVRINIHVRADNDVTTVAERVLMMPELQNYRPDLLFRVGSP